MGPAIRGAIVCALVFLVAACVPPQLKKLVTPDKTKLQDTVRSGLSTSEESPEEHDLGPYGFRVTWIAWDSGFRGTDLRIGDRITGIDDHQYTRAERKELNAHGTALGGYAEPQYWEKHGGREGKRVTLHVWRKGKTFDVTGTLRADRFYYTRDDKPALGPGGPPRIGNDGFDSAWMGWYEKFVFEGSKILDGGIRRQSVNNRMALEALLEEKPRIDYLLANYPGAFADAAKQDWQTIHDVLLGEEHTITAADLEYRTLGDQRAAEVAKVAKTAREAFVAERKKDLIEPFPAVDPIDGDIAKVKGKIVILPKMTNRDWISEGGHGYLVAGDRSRGYYFVDSRTPAMVRVLTAGYRYQELVSPKLDETYTLIGRITGDPSLRYLGDFAVTGLDVEVIGATVGDGAMFVDVTVVDDKKSSRFAGQDQLTALGAAMPKPRATPTQVVEAAFTALKVGDQEVWGRLFAPWYLSVYGWGRVAFWPQWYRDIPDDWVRARRLILDKVYDVEVVDEGLVHKLTDGTEFKGAPVVEQVEVEVEHIGKFDEGYRPFTSVDVKRVWTLQRVDGGPWRITDRRGI
jgi:hypothetical protein